MALTDAQTIAGRDMLGLSWPPSSFFVNQIILHNVTLNLLYSGLRSRFVGIFLEASTGESLGFDGFWAKTDILLDNRWVMKEEVLLREALLIIPAVCSVLRLRPITLHPPYTRNVNTSKPTTLCRIQRTYNSIKQTYYYVYGKKLQIVMLTRP